MGLPRLTLGGFDLTDWSGSIYGVSVIADGTSKGAPQPIDVAVKTWLQDGSVVVTQGYDNRDVTLRVRLRGPDLVALADAEAALFDELGKPNLLTWDANDGLTPPAVFVVITSSMEFAPSADEDLAEGTAFPWRTYNLRLTCEAFVRSATETVTAALPASGTTVTLVDNGSSATGWTGTINGATASPGVASGAVGITSASDTSNALISLTRTGTINTSSTKFLTVDYLPTAGSYVSVSQYLAAYGDGTALTQIGPTVYLGSGVYRATFSVLASSVAVLRLDLQVFHSSSHPRDAQAKTFYVDNINRTDTRPSFGTTRQQARTISVAGSARTPGTLVVSHASNALGDALIYTWSDPDGSIYQPSLRQYATVSAISDANTVFGTRFTLTAGAVVGIDVPGTAVPAGHQYLLMARCASTSGSFSGGLAGSTKTRVNGTDLDAEVTNPTTTAAFTTAYAVYPVTKFVLPSVAVRDPSRAAVRVGFWNKSASSIYVDDMWLFDLTMGRLTWIQCGTGTAASGGPSRAVFIDAPSVERPRPSILRGHAVDGADAFAAGIQAWGFHQFEPPQTSVFTVTTNTADADVSFRHYPRWHTNPSS